MICEDFSQNLSQKQNFTPDQSSLWCIGHLVIAVARQFKKILKSHNVSMLIVMKCEFRIDNKQSALMRAIYWIEFDV